MQLRCIISKNFVLINTFQLFKKDKNANANQRATVTVKGQANNMKDAKDFIESYLSEDSQNNEQRREPNRNYNQQGTDSRSIFIDVSKVGLVIGRGGSKIKELQDKYNVNVKVGMFSIQNYRLLITYIKYILLSCINRS